MSTYTKDEQKEHRRLWVEALRSGKYQQTTGALHDNTGGFCCLGVACDISGLGEWNPTYIEEYRTPDFRHEGTLETDVRNWLGLRGEEGEIGGDDETPPSTSLASLNDNGSSFAEIADIIEAEPEGLLSS